MKSALTRTLAIALAASLMLAAACPARDTGEGSWTGNAKDFSFSTLDGQQHRLSDYAGKPVVVNFLTKT